MKLHKRIKNTCFILVASLFFASNAQADVVYAARLSVNGEEFAIGNLLHWSTAEENGSASFYVEKSIDGGTTFDNVGTVEAAGNSDEEIEYRFMDIQVTDMEATYRLRQVDEDGTESFSEPVEVIKKMKNDFMIIDYSDITVDKAFNVTLDVLKAGQMDYALYTYKGEQIFKTSQQVINGLNDFEFNLQDEKEGKYKVVFEYGDEVETLNIIKIADELQKKPNVASKPSSTGGG